MLFVAWYLIKQVDIFVSWLPYLSQLFLTADDVWRRMRWDDDINRDQNLEGGDRNLFYSTAPRFYWRYWGNPRKLFVIIAGNSRDSNPARIEYRSSMLQLYHPPLSLSVSCIFSFMIFFYVKRKIGSRTLRRAVHVTRVWEMRNAYKTQVWIYEEKRPLGEHERSCDDNIKMNFQYI
jgi:hypothetical protein